MVLKYNFYKLKYLDVQNIIVNHNYINSYSIENRELLEDFFTLASFFLKNKNKELLMIEFFNSSTI